MAEQIRVLVADDHRFYREGVRTLLASEPDIVVVGEAANGEEAVERANELEPDVILMDLKMPGLNGIEKQLRPSVTHTRAPGFARLPPQSTDCGCIADSPDRPALRAGCGPGHGGPFPLAALLEPGQPGGR